MVGVKAGYQVRPIGRGWGWGVELKKGIMASDQHGTAVAEISKDTVIPEILQTRKEIQGGPHWTQ